MAERSGRIRFGEFELGVAARTLARDGAPLAVQPKVFDVLHYLIEHADRVVPKSELLDTLWPGVVVTDNVLARCISAIRRLLDDDAREPRFVQAVPRVGYRFIAPVETVGPTTPAGPADLRLAVLPFRRLDATHENDGLELGLADALIARLARLPRLIVRPLGTVREQLAAGADGASVARAQGVDLYVEGGLQHAAERVRVSASLVDVAGDETLWSESFQVERDDVFTLQESIGDRLLRALAPRLQVSEKGAGRTRLPDPGAYRYYLEGRLFMDRHTPDDLERAARRFESALDRDPAYADAWAGLAESNELLTTLGGDIAHRISAARRASARALALDPDHAQAGCVLAKIAWQHDWDWAGAGARFEALIARHPGRADLHTAASDCCAYTGAPTRAIEHAQAALEIDPISPWVNTLCIQALYMAGETDAALAQTERTLELAPGFPFARFFEGLVRYSAGDPNGAIESLEAAVASGRQDFVGVLGVAYGLAGRRQESEAVLEGLLAAGAAVPPIARAVVRLSLGRMDDAVDDLKRCLAQRDWHLLVLFTDPMMRDFGELDALARFREALALPAGMNGD